MADKSAGYARADARGTGTPTVVCLCGSTRFPEAFEIANAHESMRGRLVISLGLFGHADRPTGARWSSPCFSGVPSSPSLVRKLHYRKIDLSDEILVINVGGYVGSKHPPRDRLRPRAHGKRVRWLFPDDVAEELRDAA